MAAARWAQSAAGILCCESRSGSVRFFSTVFQGSSPSCCQTKLEFGCLSTLPFASRQDNSPPSAGRRPASVVSSVLLPQPDSPTMASEEPAGTENVRCLSNVLPLWPMARSLTLSSAAQVRASGAMVIFYSLQMVPVMSGAWLRMPTLTSQSAAS